LTGSELTGLGIKIPDISLQGTGLLRTTNRKRRSFASACSLVKPAKQLDDDLAVEPQHVLFMHKKRNHLKRLEAKNVH
jgi:hypothetical protein